MKKIFLTLCATLLVGMANAGIIYGCWYGSYFAGDWDGNTVSNLHIIGPCNGGNWFAFGKIVATGTLPSGLETDHGTENMLNNVDIVNAPILDDPKALSDIAAMAKESHNVIYVNIDAITNEAVRNYLLAH